MLPTHKCRMLVVYTNTSFVRRLEQSLGIRRVICMFSEITAYIMTYSQMSTLICMLVRGLWDMMSASIHGLLYNEATKVTLYNVV